MRPQDWLELAARLLLVARKMVDGDASILEKRVGDILPKKLSARIKLDAMKAKGR